MYQSLTKETFWAAFGRANNGPSQPLSHFTSKGAYAITPLQHGVLIYAVVNNG